MKRIKYLIGLSLLIGLVTKVGAPPPEPVCELYSRTIGDALMHPPMGGDFDTIYFTGGIPNIAWLLDTSTSMRDFPCGQDCDYITLDASCNFPNDPTFFVRLGYSPTGIAGSTPFFPECNAQDDPKPCFDPNKIYKRTSPGNVKSCNFNWVEAQCPSGTTTKYRCQLNGELYDTQSLCQRYCRSSEDSTIPSSNKPQDACEFDPTCPEGKKYRCLKEGNNYNNCYSATQCNTYCSDSSGVCVTGAGCSGSNRICKITDSPIYNQCKTSATCNNECSVSDSACKYDNNCPLGSKYKCQTPGSTYYNQCLSSTDCINNCYGVCTPEVVPSECESSIQQYGWWRDPSTGYYYFSGKALNIYPPKYMIARKAIYELLEFEEVRRVRMGIYGFTTGDGAREIFGLNPECNMLDNPSQFDQNRQRIQNYMRNNGVSTLFTDWTPTGEALFNMGQIYACNDKGGGKKNWEFLAGGAGAVKSTISSPCDSNQDSICIDVPCALNFVVLITDGIPVGDCDSYIPTTTSNDRWGDRPIMDHDPVKDFSDDGTSVSTEMSNKRCLDDIAHFLYTHDFRPDNDSDPPANGTDLSNRPGNQNVSTYVIGFAVAGGNPSLLVATASKGGGQYYDAQSFEDLRRALKEALLDILKKSSAFTTAVVPKIRTESTGGAIVGRFKPSKMPIWEGHLYRFALYSEAVADNDLNNDGDKEDTFLVDSQEDIIEEDEYGNYVKKGSTNPAVPYWDAGEKLITKPIDSRRIYTAIDTNGDGKIDRNDGMVEFKEENAGILAPYLVPDYPANCSDISMRSGVEITNPSDCAYLIISYIRGYDIFDYDSDGNRSEARQWLLGDIMHSNPIEVGPPVLPRPCKSYGAQYAYPNCIMSLFTAPDGMAPLEMYTDEYDSLPEDIKSLLSYHGGPYHAYNKFVVTYLKRKKIVVVGANDGMLHAFHSGDFISCDVNTAFCNYTEGTGEELWAFIPPDLLPKLQKALFNHQLFVDATPMVREIWYDFNDNYKKEWNEYRTVLITGERGGGVHFTALDITDVENPQFLWIFPQPDDPAGNIMGQTWSDHLPQPPPIGPVKIEDPSAPLGWKERWIVALNGGYDDLDIRGRAVFMVDAYTGEKIWQFSYDPNATDERRYMRFSFPASVGLGSHSWFFGEPAANKQKLPLFDLAFVGDAGGQVWLLNMRDPGPSGWFGYRVFEESKGSPYLKDKNPFFTIPGLTPLHPFVWAVMMGTGDRQRMYKCVGSDCSSYNLRGCKKEGCAVSISEGEITSDNFTASQSVANTSAITSENYSFSEDTGNSCEIKDSIHVDISSCQNLPDAKVASLQCLPLGDNISCTETSTETGEIKLTNPLAQKLPAFYSIRVPREWIDDMASHDSSRFTDTDLVNANIGELPSNKYTTGWRYIHNLNEIVGTSPTVPMLKLEDVLKEACITWLTFEPNCTGTSNPCAAGGAGSAWYYQANFFTGSEESKCREIFSELGATRAVAVGSAPPLPPSQSPTYSGGKLTFYTIITAPGVSTSLVTIGFGGAGTGGSTVYLLDVSRTLHEKMCTSGYNLSTHPQSICSP